MRKVTIEYQEDQTTKTVTQAIKVTKNGNFSTDWQGKLLVFKDLSENTEVVSLIGQQWVVIGRVSTDHHIIIGKGKSIYERMIINDLIKAERKSFKEVSP